MKMNMDIPYTNLLMSIMHKIRQKAEDKMKSLEVNSQQGRVISYIVENQENGIIQKDLAEAFQRRGASITSMLQGLEKKGYISREIPPDNERQKRIYAMPKGEKIVQDINNIFNGTEKVLLESLTEEEKNEFFRLLKKIDDSI